MSPQDPGWRARVCGKGALVLGASFSPFFFISKGANDHFPDPPRRAAAKNAIFSFFFVVGPRVCPM